MRDRSENERHKNMYRGCVLYLSVYLDIVSMGNKFVFMITMPRMKIYLVFEFAYLNLLLNFCTASCFSILHISRLCNVIFIYAETPLSLSLFPNLKLI